MKNIKCVVADCCIYIKENQLLKNGIYYEFETIIEPLKTELWSYYKGLYGEKSLIGFLNSWNHEKDEEREKKLTSLKENVISLDDESLFAELSQLWIIDKILHFYEASDVFLCAEYLLRAFFEYRPNKKLSYGDLTTRLIFGELEKLEGDEALFYRSNTRILFFFQLYREDINCFFENLNNLILNKAYQDSYILNVGRKEEIEKRKFLNTELDVQEMKEILELFQNHNNKSCTYMDSFSDPERYYIYNIDDIVYFFNEYFGFEREKDNQFIFNTKDIIYRAKYEREKCKGHFENLLKALEDKLNDFPALAFLFERATRNLVLEDLKNYFPCKNKHDFPLNAKIYIPLKIDKIKEQGGCAPIESLYLQAIERFSFDYDVEGRSELSNSRLELLQKLFLASLWSIISATSCMVTAQEKEIKKWKNLINSLFFYFSHKKKAEKYTASLLNQLMKLCFVNKAKVFKDVDFTKLNKSKFFESNEALLHIYYTVTHFLTEKKYALFSQLDFTGEMRHRVLPLPSNKDKREMKSKKNIPEINKKRIVFETNQTLLREFDCGLTFPYFRQNIFSNDAVLIRPNFTFKLFSESDYYEQADGGELANRDLNKKCLKTHFFYSADRNMETHSSIHHAVRAVLENSNLLLYALYDIKEYLVSIKKEQEENDLGISLLQKKLEYIFSYICLVIFPKSQKDNWESLFDSKGFFLPDTRLEFNLFEDFGKEFYITVKDFLETMFTGQSDWIEVFDFELLIYLIYFTLQLVQRDVETTNEEKELVFNCTKEDKLRWQILSDFVKKDNNNLIVMETHPYSIFFYQLLNIKSKNIDKWRTLPISAIIHLHNGDFDALPKAIKNMSDIIDDAKKVIELKSINTKNAKTKKNYEKVITEKWNRFAKMRFRNTWVDLARFSEKLDFSTFYEGSYHKLIEVDGFKQKVLYVWCYHIKCQIALAMSNDSLRIELFLGVKSNENLTPFYSITADRDPYKLSSSLSVILKEMHCVVPNMRPIFRWWSAHYRIWEEKKYVDELNNKKKNIDRKIKSLCESMVKECSNNFFKDKVIDQNTSNQNVDVLETTTTEELCKKLNEYFSNFKKEIKNWKAPSVYCREFKKSEVNKEYFPKDQIIVECYYRDSIRLNFGIILNDVALQMQVYFDFYQNGRHSLFRLKVSEYKLFCDFVFFVYEYIKNHTLTYSSKKEEVLGLKNFHKEVLDYYIKKACKECLIGQSQDITLLENLKNDFNPNINLNSMIEGKRLYDMYLNLEYFEKEQDVPYRCSYQFNIYNKDDKTCDVWWFFYIHVDVLLKENNKELELSLFFDEWDEDGNRVCYPSYSIPLAQYTLLPSFITTLYEYWFNHSDSYYEIIEKNNGDSFTRKEKTTRTKHIAQVFNKIAKKIFQTDEETELVTLSPKEFMKRIKALEDPDYSIGSSYTEIIEINGIRQLIISTGIDALHIQLAVTFNDSLSELEVYLNEKRKLSDEPLFVLNASDYGFLELFFAELKANQAKLFAKKK